MIEFLDLCADFSGKVHASFRTALRILSSTTSPTASRVQRLAETSEEVGHVVGAIGRWLIVADPVQSKGIAPAPNRTRTVEERDPTGTRIGSPACEGLGTLAESPL